MPSKSAKQRKFMAAVANNPKFAKEVGVPQSVGRKFDMPYGPGTYGSKVGRPPKKFKTGGKLTDEEKKWWDKEQKKMMKRSGLTLGPKKRRSSRELQSELELAEIERIKASREKYGDRGVAGLESRMDESEAASESRMQDRDLIREYGKDAPMARSYSTPARKGDAAAVTRQLEELESGKKKGGKIKKKKSYNRSGKVRGAGCARQGVRKVKMVTMNGA